MRVAASLSFATSQADRGEYRQAELLNAALRSRIEFARRGLLHGVR